MDERYLDAIRQTASLAFHLVAIENAVRVAEELNEFRFLPEAIRWHLSQAEEIAGDDLARGRRILRGDYSH